MIQTITIIILSIACVSLVFKDKVIQVITKRKILKETQRVKEIQTIVKDYLEKLAKK
tara:strand:+ start:1417 stop:1587 length:171 start_codon:yes stop_codon:yes gene_type:complete